MLATSYRPWNYLRGSPPRRHPLLELLEPVEDDVDLAASKPDETGIHWASAAASIFLASAVDLLIESWPQLRRCEHEGCRSLFLPEHGRQHYHAPACRQAAYRLRNKGKRDHSGEHRKRQLKETGNAHRCEAKTGTGVQCKRNAQPDTFFCKQHAKEGRN